MHTPNQIVRQSDCHRLGPKDTRGLLLLLKTLESGGNVKNMLQSALSKHTRFVEAKNDLNCVLREDVSLWRYSGRYCVWTKFEQLERCVFTE